MKIRKDIFDDYEGCESGIDTTPVEDQEMMTSARDWEIIRNRSFGGNDRVWSTDDDYKEYIAMNIFVLDKDPVKAARYHNDRHVIKMILESAQLLSTAHVVLDGIEAASKRVPLLLRPSHVNHPCALWARSTGANYSWLYRLLLALLAEYTRRYGKVHRYAQAPVAAGAVGAPPTYGVARSAVPGPAPAALAGVAAQLAAYPMGLRPGGRLQPWAQCMPPQYKRAPANAVAAYRAYYWGEKQHIARWHEPAVVPAWWANRQERIRYVQDFHAS